MYPVHPCIDSPSARPRPDGYARFGTTSNLAARAQHESLGGDLVATPEVVGDAGVRRLLATIPHRDEPFRARRKGFDDEVTLHRVVVA